MNKKYLTLVTHREGLTFFNIYKKRGLRYDDVKRGYKPLLGERGVNVDKWLFVIGVALGNALAIILLNVYY